MGSSRDEEFRRRVQEVGSIRDGGFRMWEVYEMGVQEMGSIRDGEFSSSEVPEIGS